jgi:hypothetical protein
MTAKNEHNDSHPQEQRQWGRGMLQVGIHRIALFLLLVFTIDDRSSDCGRDGLVGFLCSFPPSLVENVILNIVFYFILKAEAWTERTRRKGRD